MSSGRSSGRPPATLFFGLAVILATEALLFADLVARGWAVVPYEALPPPQGALEAVARWIAGNVTAICWTALLFVLDGLLAWRRLPLGAAGSPVRARPRRFGLCWLASIPIWLSFDAVNFGWLHAWAYHGLPEDDRHRLAGYALAFGAICPAMFLVAAVAGRLGLRGLRGRALPIPPRADPWLAVLGLLLLAFPFAVQAPAGTLTLWLAWIPLLEPLNRRLGAPSLFADWAAGRWGRTLSLAAAGLVCGLLWEFWNYWATAKWTYDLPFLGPLESLRYFEMSLPGMAGFAPFALECWVMFQTVAALLVRLGLRRIEPLPDHDTIL